MRHEHTLTDDEFAALVEATKPLSPTMQIDLHAGLTTIERPASRQRRANDWWEAFGEAHGFDGGSIKFVSGADGKSPLVFTAEPVVPLPPAEFLERARAILDGNPKPEDADLDPEKVREALRLSRTQEDES